MGDGGKSRGREAPDGTRRLHLRGLGASSYKVSVVSFSSSVGKKNKTQGSMVVKGLGWDANLGEISHPSPTISHHLPMCMQSDQLSQQNLANISHHLPPSPTISLCACR